MNSYQVNNLIRLAVQFNDLITQAPIDPTTIILYVTAPDGTESEFTYAANQIIRDGTGAYHYDVNNTVVGIYDYQFEGGGNIIASSFGQFKSTPSPFGTQ